MRAAPRTVLLDGFFLGLIGYLAVAGGYLVLDVASGRPALYTAALLGQGLFGTLGAGGPTVQVGPILAFNGAHLIGFLAIGMVTAMLVHEAEAHPRFWYPAFFTALAVLVYGYAVAMVAAEAVQAILAPADIVLVDLFSAACMVVYLMARHRSLARTVEREGDPESVSVAHAARPT